MLRTGIDPVSEDLESPAHPSIPTEQILFDQFFRL
jgi:hypothetical protein